jgi:hypothetical protein
MEWATTPLLKVQRAAELSPAVLGPRLRSAHALCTFYHAEFQAVFVVTETSIEAFRWNPELGWQDKLVDRRLCVVFECPERLRAERKQSGVVQLGGLAGARVLRATAATYLASSNEVLVAHEDLSLRCYACESGELGFETRSTILVLDDQTTVPSPAEREYVTKLHPLPSGAVIAGHVSGRVTYLDAAWHAGPLSLVAPERIRQWLGAAAPVAGVSALAVQAPIPALVTTANAAASPEQARRNGAATEPVSESDSPLVVAVGYTAGFLLLIRGKLMHPEIDFLGWMHCQEIVDVLFWQRWRCVCTASRPGEVALTSLDTGRTLHRQSLPFCCAFARAQNDDRLLVGGDAPVPVWISIESGASSTDIGQPGSAHQAGGVADGSETTPSRRLATGLSRLSQRLAASMITMTTGCWATSASDFIFVTRSGQLAWLSTRTVSAS